MKHYIGLHTLLLLSFWTIGCQSLPHFIVDRNNVCVTSAVIPADTLVTIYYELPNVDFVEKPRVGPDTINLAIYPVYSDDDDEDEDYGRKRVDRRRKSRRNKRELEPLHASQGTVTYQTNPSEPSALKLCIQSRNLKKSNPLRVGLRVVIGHDITYYRTTAREQHLSSMQINLMKTNDEVLNMLHAADHMKTVEYDFFRYMQSVHSAAWYWPMMQTILVGTTGVLGIWYMTNFFGKHVL